MHSIKENVKVLLENLPELRDNSGELSLQYRFTFTREVSLEDFIKNKMESKITRASADIQLNYPELRGAKWWERQSHGKKTAKSYTVAEDVSYVFEKETFLQYICRYFFTK